MRICLAQTNIIWEDKNKNIEKACRLVETHEDADVIFFPEMSFTGFSMNTDITADDEENISEIIKKIAMKYNVFIGYGWVRKTEENEKNTNVYSIMSPNGKKISEYVKIHPFSLAGEDKFFLSGTRITQFTIKNVPFSNFICYDLRFPEIFQVASKYAHVIIIPANWPQKRREHWLTLLKARAIENQIYIMGINCVGNIGCLNYSGDSCVINPEGEVIGILSGSEGVLVFDFEDDVEDFRGDFPIKEDRKEKLYLDLMKG